jgi:uncharacterized protein
MSVLLPITLFFVGLFALIQVPLTVMVGYRRVQTEIRFLDGGDRTLLRRMRVHGNFTETVPMILLAMAAAEAVGAPPWLLWAAGLSLLAGRLLHGAVLLSSEWGNGRAIGMVLTLLPMAGLGGYAVYSAMR